MNSRIKDFLLGKDHEIFTSEDENYEYLLENEELAVVLNPYSEADLYIKTSPAQLLLMFAGWTGLYSNSDEGEDLLVKDAENIMNDDSYVWSVDMGEVKMVGLVNDSGSLFCKMALSHPISLAQLDMEEYADFMEDMEQAFYFWNPKALDPNPSPLLN